MSLIYRSSDLAIDQQENPIIRKQEIKRVKPIPKHAKTARAFSTMQADRIKPRATHAMMMNKFCSQVGNFEKHSFALLIKGGGRSLNIRLSLYEIQLSFFYLNLIFYSRQSQRFSLEIINSCLWSIPTEKNLAQWKIIQIKMELNMITVAKSV